MSLTILFRNYMGQFNAGAISREDLLRFCDSHGHDLLQEVRTEDISLITRMLDFVAGGNEGQIFSFLMNRDLTGNTIGHVVCSQDFCKKHNVIVSGTLEAFLACLGKLTPQCRPDYLAVKNTAGLKLDDVVREMRIDSVKQAYYRFFQKEVRLPLLSAKSAFCTHKAPVQNGRFFKDAEEGAVVLPPPSLKAGNNNRKKYMPDFQPIRPSK